MRALKLLVSLVCLMSLVGCFEITEEIWVNADGSGKIKLELAVPKEQKNKASKKDPKEELKKRLEGVEGVESFDVTEKEDEDGLYRTIIEVKLKDITQAGEVHKKLLSGASPGKKKNTFPLEIVKKDGNYQFSMTFEASEKPQGKNKKLAEQMKKQMAKMFADKSFTIKVHGPSLTSVKEGGKVSDDGKTVTWNLPLTDLMDLKEDKVISTTVQPSSGSGFMIFIIALLIGLAIGGFIVFQKQKQGA